MKLHDVWLKKLANWLGYELISTQKLSGTQMGANEHLSILLRDGQINHVIDVGANRGQFAQSLRSMGFKGKISSFEPAPSVYAELHEAAQGDPDWKTFQMGLGRRAGELELRVCNNDVFSSFREFNDYSATRFNQKGIAAAQVENVKVERLDSLSEVLGLDDRTRVHLKIDTQGFDLEVFAGCSGILPWVHSMQSEVSVTPIYKDSPDYIEQIACYRTSGFELTALYPITGDRGSLILVECDCYMSKRKPGAGR